MGPQLDTLSIEPIRVWPGILFKDKHLNAKMKMFWFKSALSYFYFLYLCDMNSQLDILNLICLKVFTKNVSNME